MSANISLMQKVSFETIFNDFVSLFYPRYCLGCSGSLVKGEDVICSRCMLEMPQTNYHLEQVNPLQQRFLGRLDVQLISALFRFSKNGVIQHLLHELKYKRHPEIGIMLGNLYGHKLKDCTRSLDLIVPVPLHPSRYRKRGYNQSAMFAKGLSDTLNIPYSDHILKRSTNTLTQTKKTKLRRWENVSSVFQLADEQQIKNKNLLLVDDVITTGATLEACGTVLLGHGCKSLSIVCIAEA